MLKIKEINTDIILLTKQQMLFGFHQLVHYYPFSCSKIQSRISHKGLRTQPKKLASRINGHVFITEHVQKQSSIHPWATQWFKDEVKVRNKCKNVYSTYYLIIKQILTFNTAIWKIVNSKYPLLQYEHHYLVFLAEKTSQILLPYPR